MVWFRRIIAVVALLGLGLGYTYVRQQRAAGAESRRMELALLTAKTWVASAEFHKSPEAYLAVRDSILAAAGENTESMRNYLDRYRGNPDEYEEYTRLVSFYVDSLISERGKLSDTALFDTVR